MINEHTSKQFDAELESVRMSVLKMGGLVEGQFNAALKALATGDTVLIEKIIKDDHLINMMEVSIDKNCSQIIARRQPAAGDLRMIMMIIKTITDLERIGDEATKIARMARLLYADSQFLQKSNFAEIRHVAIIALEMLHEALDAFVHLDITAAVKIVRQDKLVDKEFRSIIRQLGALMMEDSHKISIAIETVFMAKAIERIGDHAKNIAEYVIYMVKGKDVRHVTLEEMEREF